MHIYDTLIIGSGYASAGYAHAHENSIICEENEICDTHFYMPMKGFKKSGYEPVTDLGKELCKLYNELGLIGADMQNINGFESGFCRFLELHEADILLKCRIVDITPEPDDISRVTVITNAGLESIYAKRIIDMRGRYSSGEKCLTVLFVTDDCARTEEQLSRAFPGSRFEKAFYDNRYAIYIPAAGYDDMNALKMDIYDKWKKSGVDAKILYIAPITGIHNAAGADDSLPYDDLYNDPIEAYEAGYLFEG